MDVRIGSRRAGSNGSRGPRGEAIPDRRASQLRYFAGGSGPPLLLVHGLGGAASNWTELAPLLSRRLPARDPGSAWPWTLGQAPRPQPPGRPRGRRSRLCRGRGCRSSRGVGHSLGGEVALRLAIDRPAAVRALVLAASWESSKSLLDRVGLEVSGAIRPGRAASRFRTRIAADPRLRRACFFRARRGAALGGGGPRVPRRRGLATDTRTAMKALIAEDLRVRAAPRRMPGDAALGGARPARSPRGRVRIARRLRAPLRLLPETGHLLIAERPWECAALIDEFLGDGRARRELVTRARARLEQQALYPEPLREDAAWSSGRGSSGCRISVATARMRSSGGSPSELPGRADRKSWARLARGSPRPRALPRLAAPAPSGQDVRRPHSVSLRRESVRARGAGGRRLPRGGRQEASSSRPPPAT